jgi:hypothetical protein
MKNTVRMVGLCDIIAGVALTLFFLLFKLSVVVIAGKATKPEWRG